MRTLDAGRALDSVGRRAFHCGSLRPSVIFCIMLLSSGYRRRFGRRVWDRQCRVASGPDDATAKLLDLPLQRAFALVGRFEGLALIIECPV